VSFVHDRLPVVLDGIAAEAAWLGPDVDLAAVLELVRPLPTACSTSIPLDEAQLKPRRGDELLTPLRG